MASTSCRAPRTCPRSPSPSVARYTSKTLCCTSYSRRVDVDQVCMVGAKHLLHTLDPCGMNAAAQHVSSSKREDAKADRLADMLMSCHRAAAVEQRIYLTGKRTSCIRLLEECPVATPSLHPSTPIFAGRTPLRRDSLVVRLANRGLSVFATYVTTPERLAFLCTNAHNVSSDGSRPMGPRMAVV